MSKNNQREPQPFFRKSKNAWYLQLGSRQVSLGKNKTAAWKRYHEIMANREALQNESVTIECLFENFLDWVKTNRRPGTYDKVRHHLSRFARFIGKSRKAQSLSGSDLSDWVEGELSWGSTTRNEAVTSVIRCYNWAVGKRYLKSNYVSHVHIKSYQSVKVAKGFERLPTAIALSASFVLQPVLFSKPCPGKLDVVRSKQFFLAVAPTMYVFDGNLNVACSFSRFLHHPVYGGK